MDVELYPVPFLSDALYINVIPTQKNPPLRVILYPMSASMWHIFLTSGVSFYCIGIPLDLCFCNTIFAYLILQYPVSMSLGLFQSYQMTLALLLLLSSIYGFENMPSNG